MQPYLALKTVIFEANAVIFGAYKVIFWAHTVKAGTNRVIFVAHTVIFVDKYRTHPHSIQHHKSWVLNYLNI